MTWQFAAILITALVLGIVLSSWQNRVYLRHINQLARAHAGSNRKLVSGRSKGRLRGAVVVLVIDPDTRSIVDASTMTGSTIFSRFHPAPDLHGPMTTVTQRTTSKHLQKAATDALHMLPAGLRPAVQVAAPPAGRTRVRLSRPTTSI